MIIRDQFHPHFVSLVFFVYSGSGRDTGHLHFSTPHLLPGRGHGTGDSQGHLHLNVLNLVCAWEGPNMQRLTTCWRVETGVSIWVQIKHIQIVSEKTGSPSLDARHVDAQTIQRLLAPTPTWSHGGSAPTVQLRLAKFGLHTEERLNRYASAKDIFIAAGLLSHDRVAPSLYPSRRGHHLA